MFTTANSDVRQASTAGGAEPLPKYLHQRGNVYYFKRKVPASIEWAFDCKRQVWESLCTSDLVRARKALDERVREFDNVAAKAQQKVNGAYCRLERTRARGEGTVKYLLEQHIEALLARFEYVHLSIDDELRLGLSEWELVERKLELEEDENQLRHQAATADYVGYEEGMQQLLTCECLIAPPGSHVRRKLMECMLQRDIRIVQTQRERLEGIVVPAPERPPTSPRHLPTMLDVVDVWARKQERSRTIDTYRGFVTEFEGEVDALPCSAIKLGHVEKFRDYLQGRGLARETVKNYMLGLSTLFRDGIEQKLIALSAPNPFEVVNLDGIPVRPKSEQPRAFEDGELDIIFRSRLYTAGYRPEGQTAEAAYWAPLCAVFIGARIEELSQARLEDIQRINGTWAIRISEMDAEQHLKTNNSYRYVPLHDNLIRCGFLAYVAETKLAGHERLFPSLRNNNKHKVWSNALGKWFSGYLDSIGLTDDRVCFKSFRGSFKQRCSRSGIGDEVRDALSGHWVSKSTPGRLYMRTANAQYPFPLLVEAMKNLRYDEVDLAHLYVPNAYKGVDEALRDSFHTMGLPKPVSRKRASRKGANGFAATTSAE